MLRIRSIKLGFILTLLVMIAISCAYSSKASRQLLEEALNKKYEVIVVPGVPFENGQWSATMKDRVFWSKYLFEKGVAENVMYSGSSVYTPYREAEIMAIISASL